MLWLISVDPHEDPERTTLRLERHRVDPFHSGCFFTLSISAKQITTTNKSIVFHLKTHFMSFLFFESGPT